MFYFSAHTADLIQNGFTVIEQVFSQREIDKIVSVIGRADCSKPTFRKSADLFAIRQFLKEVPEVIPLIFTERLKSIIEGMFGDDYFLVKSIYFDKPGAS